MKQPVKRVRLPESIAYGRLRQTDFGDRGVTMTESEELRDLQRQTAAAQASAYQRLAADASDKAVRSVAADLGGLLLSLADDPRLSRLLPAHARLEVQDDVLMSRWADVLLVDWETLVREAGAEPPPAERAARDVVAALAQVRAGGPLIRDIHVRAALRELGSRLQQTAPPPSQTRRRVGRALLWVGWATATTTLLVTLPHVAPLLVLGLSPQVQEQVRAALPEVVKDLVGAVLPAPLGPSDKAEEADLLRRAKTLDALVAQGPAGRLIVDWDVLVALGDTANPVEQRRLLERTVLWCATTLGAAAALSALLVGDVGLAGLRDAQEALWHLRQLLAADPPPVGRIRDDLRAALDPLAGVRYTLAPLLQHATFGPFSPRF